MKQEVKRKTARRIKAELGDTPQSVARKKASDAREAKKNKKTKIVEAWFVIDKVRDRNNKINTKLVKKVRLENGNVYSSLLGHMNKAADKKRLQAIIDKSEYEVRAF